MKAIAVLCLLVAAFLVPQSAVAQMTAPDGVWLRVGWFAPVTWFPSENGGDVVGGSETSYWVRLSSGLSGGAEAEWSIRPSWTATVALVGARTYAETNVRSWRCTDDVGEPAPCPEPKSPTALVAHGHVGLVRDLQPFRVGLGVGPRLLRVSSPYDCTLIDTRCLVAQGIFRQHTVTVMGTGLVGVEHTLLGRGVRLDLQHGVSVHRGSVQQELVLSGGVRVFR